MKTKGGFTLPGESGYERLTLELCEKWGADCIRDSDGTQLSDEILSSGVPIYSTICMIRSVNEWAKKHPEMLQRNFLSTDPVLSLGGELKIKPLEKYFRPQFDICPDDDVKKLWEVWDRTAEEKLDVEKWNYDPETETVTISDTVPYHLYTVSFMARRLWEEISMYNHITNDWGDKEHLMAVEPRYPEVRAELLRYLDEWCEKHPATKVVRFTSMFYNFTWIWGADPAQRTVYTDWGSYDFTVNPIALDGFEAEYGYRMTAEDFIRNDRHNPTHTPPSKRYLDWIEYTGKFVREFGRECVDIVHKHGKLAYVFYDDSWVGIEPWSGKFAEFGFDGLIKCVFNAFEARLCAGVEDVGTHELRLHPYLFPTGLKGEPTFAPGGHPDADARRYWACVRRALLRVKIDRIGLGGYLSLTEPFPKFQDEIANIADEFRMLKGFHEAGKPWSTGIRVAILQSWGSLRTWNCSGHMHEHPELPLNHIYEALAGQPFEVRAISLAEIAKNGVPADVDVIINAGREGDAWSGGDGWTPEVLEALNKFVACGGGFIGVGEPSALRKSDGKLFRTADIIGVDKEIGETVCFEKYKYSVKKDHFITKDTSDVPHFHNHVSGVYARGADTHVILASGGDIVAATKFFGDGRGAYLSGFTFSSENARLLYRSILWAAGKEELENVYMTSDPNFECAYFPATDKLVIINNSTESNRVTVKTPSGVAAALIDGEGIAVISLN